MCWRLFFEPQSRACACWKTARGSAVGLSKAALDLCSRRHSLGTQPTYCYKRVIGTRFETLDRADAIASIRAESLPRDIRCVGLSVCMPRRSEMVMGMYIDRLIFIFARRSHRRCGGPPPSPSSPSLLLTPPPPLSTHVYRLQLQGPRPSTFPTTHLNPLYY